MHQVLRDSSFLVRTDDALARSGQETYIIFKNCIFDFLNPIEKSSDVAACDQSFAVWKNGKEINLSLASVTVQKTDSSGKKSTWTETNSGVSVEPAKCIVLKFSTQQFKFVCTALWNPDFLSHPPDPQNVAKRSCDQIFERLKMLNEVCILKEDFIHSMNQRLR